MTSAVHGFPDYQTSLRTADLVTDTIVATIAAGGGFTSGVYDMRNYQSLNLYASFVSTVIPATGYGNIAASLLWFADSGLDPLYTESYKLFPYTQGATFPADAGVLYLTDAIKGPYLRVDFENQGPDQIRYEYRLLGNSRPSPRRYVRGDAVIGSVGGSPSSGLFVSDTSNLAAGTSANYFIPIAPGPAQLRMGGSTTQHTYVFADPNGHASDTEIIAAAATINRQTILPRSAMRLTVTNNGAGISSHTVIVTSAMLEG